MSGSGLPRWLKAALCFSCSSPSLLQRFIHHCPGKPAKTSPAISLANAPLDGGSPQDLISAQHSGHLDWPVLGARDIGNPCFHLWVRWFCGQAQPFARGFSPGWPRRPGTVLQGKGGTDTVVVSVHQLAKQAVKEAVWGRSRLQGFPPSS